MLICFVALVEFGAQFVKAMLTLAHPKTEARSTFLNVLSADLQSVNMLSVKRLRF